jgi:alpha-1,3-rhamnosyl/mannosyltransferase
MTTHIILVNWNSLADTRRCLRSLLVLEDPPAHVWLIDNGSTDGSAQALEAWALGYPIPISVLQMGRNLGFGGGCNIGMRRALDAGAQFVWLLNNDAVVQRDALTALHQVMVLDDRVGAVGSVIYDLQHPEKVLVWGGGTVLGWLGVTRHVNRPTPDDRLDFLTGASLYLRREALEATGLFNAERYFMYWEDTDLCFRLRAAGWKLAVAEVSKIWHQHSSSLGSHHPLKDYYVTVSAGRFLDDHHPAPPVGRLLGALIRSIKRLFFGRFSNVMAIWRGWRSLPYDGYAPAPFEKLPYERRKTLRIAMEATTLKGRRAGIGHFTAALLDELSADPSTGMAYFTSTSWATTAPRAQGLRIPSKGDWKKKIPLGREAQYLLQGIQLARLKRVWRPDVILGMNYVLPPARAPEILVVYDLSHIRYPEVHPPGRVHFLTRHLRHALARAAAVVTTSQFSKSELLTFFPETAGRIHVAYPGIDQRFNADVTATDDRALVAALDGNTQDYFLFLSTLEPRKNLARLLIAYEGLPKDVRARHPLVLVGQMGWQESQFAASLLRMMERGEVIMTGYLRDALLPAVYERALALVYPSLYEGFGMPPVEAMACHCPVLVSRVTAMPEVCGDAAVYCDPLNVESIRAGMLQLAQDGALRTRLKIAGYDKAQAYRWDRAGQILLTALREATGRA